MTEAVPQDSQDRAATRRRLLRTAAGWKPAYPGHDASADLPAGETRKP